MFYCTIHIKRKKCTINVINHMHHEIINHVWISILCLTMTCQMLIIDKFTSHLSQNQIYNSLIKENETMHSGFSSDHVTNQITQFTLSAIYNDIIL